MPRNNATYVCIESSYEYRLHLSENRRYYHPRCFPMKVLETDRLILRWLSPDDDAFILELLNEPSFIRFIGDKSVRTIEDARKYILNGPVASYKQFGFGLYAVELKESNVPI